MGDTGTTAQRPPTGADPMPRLALFALVVCLLSVTAAVVSFANGSWLGVVWVLLTGLSSNMAWYYFRRDRLRARTAAGTRAR
ncbi:hypothetical protein GT204_09485 [Streptomyces sp. SID4919]|uniref:hypothetical protein n=2 Tax=unclassified Streptomyces TaxID=2593676 RepID=UPI000C070B68|nr:MULTISPECIES: hypothetical protein [unclassified Streptomyces]MYY09129.1 hypothetical protein [Streptomyces sp. SID4919]